MLNAQWLTCNWDMTKKLSYLQEKKALNPHWFCFDRPLNWTFDMIIYCAQSMCFVRSIFACVSGVYYKTEESGMELNIKNEICGIHWEKERIKLTQMKGKQCDLILFRAWLCYFYITFTFIAWSCCLMSY